MGKINKINIFDEQNDFSCFNSIALNIKHKKLTKEDKLALLKCIEGKDPNITRESKIKERQEFRLELLKKRKLKISNSVNKTEKNLQEKSFEVEVVKTDGPSEEKLNISILSKLPVFAETQSEGIKKVLPSFLTSNKKKEFKTKSKSSVEIFTKQANDIFHKRILQNSHSELPNLLFKEENLNNKLDSSCFSLNESGSIKKIENIKIIKPAEYLPKTELEKTDNTEKRLTFQNLSLQEFKLNTIIKEAHLVCNHFICEDFIKKCNALEPSGEAAFSFYRRYLFFDMEMFESSSSLHKGNIRQLCFLPNVYNKFLKQCAKLQPLEKQANDSYDYNTDSRKGKWTILNTTIDSQSEVDFDLKYMCLKENDFSNSFGNIDEPDCLEVSMLKHQNKSQSKVNENSCMSFSSFVKPLPNNVSTINIPCSLTARVKEFQKANKKLKNVMAASSNREIYKENTFNISDANNTSLSLANNSDLPPWFKKHRKRYHPKNKKITGRIPLKKISKNHNHK